MPPKSTAGTETTRPPKKSGSAATKPAKAKKATSSPPSVPTQRRTATKAASERNDSARASAPRARKATPKAATAIHRSDIGVALSSVESKLQSPHVTGIRVPAPEIAPVSAGDPAAVPAASKMTRLAPPQKLVAIAMGVVLVSAFLPWVSVFGLTRSGIAGDGVITLVLAIAGLVVLAFSTGVVGEQRSPGRASRVSLLGLGVLVALVGAVDMNGAAAIGLYLTFLAGVAWIVGAVWEMNRAKQ
jgi:VIT1/CCC1 family predicted Fe2+/Mn2+ transporter